MVFDISAGLEQHKKHFNFSKWNEFRLFSQYIDPENMTIVFSGKNGENSVLLLDDIVISVKKLNKSSL